MSGAQGLMWKPISLTRLTQLFRKGISSLRAYGLRATLWRARFKLYGLWVSRNSTVASPFSVEDLAAQRNHVFSRRILISVIVPLHNTPEAFLRAMIRSVLDQTYTAWELCLVDGSDECHGDVRHICGEYVASDDRVRYRRIEGNLGIAGNTNVALAMASGDYVALLDHDDLLHPAALFEVARTIVETGAEVVYTDEALFINTPDDAFDPHYKPAFAPDTLRANNYLCHLTTFSRELAAKVGPFDPACDGAQDFDMVLRLTEQAKGVAHIPEVLYYWRSHGESTASGIGAKPIASAAGALAVRKHLARQGMVGTVEPIDQCPTIYRTRYAIEGDPLVSIVIPNRDHLDDLRACLDSIFQRTTWPRYEVIVVENGSTSPELFGYYDLVQRGHHNVCVVVSDVVGFDFSALCNVGVRASKGDVVLLLNNDTQVIAGDWIQEMLMFAQRPDVGAVGSKLLYPDGRIQHAGLALDRTGVAHHYCRGFFGAFVGYEGRLLYAQNLTAVTGACMMVRRDVWDELGGLDSAFPVDFNDVDFCLRAREAGYLVVWTPFAELVHGESRSRGAESARLEGRSFQESVGRFRRRWRDALEAGDPYLNPNLLHVPQGMLLGIPVERDAGA